MLCEECNVRPAEVTITTVIGGEKTVRHLCRDCMKKYQNGDISSLMAAILSSMTPRKTENAETDAVCPNCGMHISQFRKSGVLGCAECYQAFKEELRPLFTRIQGRTQHAGRRPPASPEEQERIRKMEELRKKLEDAVQAEEYEMAARFRDELKELQQSKVQEAEPGSAAIKDVQKEEGKDA
ncbi:MAG: UvrB/UvrC motif-containing protein [Clostridia bacterium]|nr:UvrB/UvrC motif-containing protein [Clostridia bacterium]